MNDDLDEEIIDSEDGFDEFSQKAGLVDIIRQSAAAKIVIVVVAVAAIGGILMTFGEDTVKDKMSSVPTGSEITSIPGTDEKVAPAYIEAVEEQNEADLERAMVEGGSSIPVPIETHDTRLEVPEMQEESEDPLHRWRALQEERVEREMKVREVEAEPVTVLNAEQQSEAIQELSDSMREQMESILTKTSEVTKFTTRTLITYDSTNGNGGNNNGGYDDNGSGGYDNSAFTEDIEETVVISAGKIVYGQMLLEANSDVPSVILAQMVSGPLKGWKLLGEFEALDDIEGLAITFDLAVNEDGKQYELDAIMLNPDTGLAAMSTDVNHRYLRRIVFPAAAAFVEGFSEAIAESGATTVTISGDTVTEGEEESTDEQEIATGVTEAATVVTEILDDMGDVPIQIIIAAGTPIGIFFTENVVEDESDI